MTPVPWIEYHEQSVQLHSGGWSHYLVRADLMFEDERIREEVLRTWEALVRSLEPPVVFVGVPTGGTRWAEAIAQRTGWLDFDALGAHRGDGTVVIVDDVFTTGASVRAAEAEAIAAGASAVLVLCVLDRSGELNETISWARIPLPLEERP